jgi:hypothetical protein
MRSMKPAAYALGLVILAAAVPLRAQAPDPKPAPEIQKLQILAGHWKYEGVDKGELSGRSGKFSGEYTGRMIVGGAFFQDESVEKGPAGEVRSLDIYRYDPVNKNFPFTQYLSNGTSSSGTLTVNGNTLIWESPIDVEGKAYTVRDTFLYDPAALRFAGKAEISADGETWRLWFEATYTKVKVSSRNK